MSRLHTPGGLQVPLTRSGRGMGAIELARPLSPAYGSAHGLIGAGAESATHASMADLVFVPPGFGFADQETNQECVGWKMCQLVHIWCRAHGLPPLTPSPTGTYFGTRARRYGWDGVWDGGCNPHEAFEHVAEAGIIPYEAWPHSTWHVNDNPDPGCYRKAVDNQWVRPYWVLGDRTRTVKGLLASKQPVGIALMVDSRLEQWRPGDEPWKRTGPIVGGHDVTIVGFDQYGGSSSLDKGKVAFIVANSWGPDHGDHGFFLLSQEALEADENSYVCTIDIDREKMPS